MKLKTAGLNKKVPAQAITTVLVAALAYFGVDLDPEVSAALGVVVGFVAGYFAPAAPTVTVAKRTTNGEAGTTPVETLTVIFLVLAIIVLILWLT